MHWRCFTVAWLRGDGVVDEPTDSQTPPGLRPGSRFGRYRLRRLLGRGGHKHLNGQFAGIDSMAVQAQSLPTVY